MIFTKNEKRIKRHARVRAKIKGIAKIPRLSVFRSNKNMFVQVIDDEAGKTIASNSLKNKKTRKETKTKTAGQIGETIAKKIIEAGISQVVFDRGGYKYHGRVKALAEGLRKGGLKF